MGTADSKIKKVEEISFFLQNKEHIVKLADITPQTSLNDYIRNHLQLKGTKAMCREGGCGCCVVVLEGKNPTTQNDVTFAVNSCLVPVLSCYGWKIFTVEGLGGSNDEYHSIQKILAKFNGTQCGFCSPGMVMNMYALLETKKSKLTMKEIEKSFSGNICRCTGYRPILSAFKTFASDFDTKYLGTLPDIEDIKICEKTNKICTNNCLPNDVEAFYQIFENSKWVKVLNINDLLQALQHLDSKSTYMLICGNTAQGVHESYKETKDLYIDVSNVVELKSYELKDDKLILGANITLNDAIDIFIEVSSKNSKFNYLKSMAEHIDLVANVPVRNTGSLGGNLMIKHDYSEFPSDIFLIMETVDAVLTVTDISKEETMYSPKDFLAIDMDRKVLKSITLTAYDDSYKFVSYKIMPRSQNAHAIVNAGFLFKLQNETVKTVRLVYGNINSTFIHAIEAEKYLINKILFENKTIQGVCDLLDKELIAAEQSPDPSPKMRKNLAISLFYKAVLSLAPESKITARNKSGREKLIRPVSTGSQDFETNESLYPLTENIPKVEALAQTSGHTQYIPDMPDQSDQLFAVFVLAKAPAYSVIEKIDASKALAAPDIVAVYTKDDIPGDNSFMDKDYFGTIDEIFCSGVVKYYEQPTALIVGKSEKAAMDARDLVEITYKTSTKKPLISTKDILKAGATDKIQKVKTHNAKSKGNDIEKVVKGTFNIKGQFHFHMETHCTQAIPVEDSLDVYSSTQWMDVTQRGISKMLKLPMNKINIIVRRCGGAFGAKISRGNLAACATSLAAWKLKKPVRMWMNLPDNMKAIGKRFPFYMDYEIAFNKKGVIQYCNAKLYSDVGIITNESPANEIVETFVGAYNDETFEVDAYLAYTDMVPNTWCRAPCTTEAIAAIESLMEHSAYELGMDSVELRKLNMKHTKANDYLDDLYQWADIVKRKNDIQQFNRENRWKKKGLAIVPMTYFFQIYGPFPCLVSIFASDGSVSISHGGIEIGQGINTKVTQVCAWKLGIPLEQIRVIPSYSYLSANAFVTGGSITSEAICYAVEQACNELLTRMEPYKKANPNISWKELINKCSENGVDLQARAIYTPNAPGIKPYEIYGATAVEVLLDILTGQHMISRADVILDTGRSISSGIDIGQVEGAFIMGFGYYTSENLVYDSDGKLLTYGTWNYKVPLARDIPIDFRVKFPKNNENPVGVLKSKATGEPPFCMTIACPLAIRNAVASARAEADPSQPAWYPLDGPSTVEDTFLNCLHNYKQYTL